MPEHYHSRLFRRSSVLKQTILTTRHIIHNLLAVTVFYKVRCSLPDASEIATQSRLHGFGRFQNIYVVVLVLDSFLVM
jgi:hypothetical protein